VLVHGDERTVLQIVLNLILNAEDALAGQPRRELRLIVDRNAAVGTLTVADTGHGVEDGIRVRIFEPFFTTRGERAVGLGLPVAGQLAAHAGGQVQLRDTAPGATTFVVELPLA
jgi:C4-dicarboxylate-specific signal transduction histidine kinase